MISSLLKAPLKCPLRDMRQTSRLGVDSEGGGVAAQIVPGAAESVVDGIFVRLHRQYAAGRGKRITKQTILGAVREVREIHSLESAR